MAPVIASGEIEIVADPEVVWKVMAAIDRWPDWNPDVKSASLNGELAAGSEFRWKAGPGTITSKIQQVERPRALAWTGRSLGIDAFHVWRLEPRDGKTVVRTEESWDGLLVRIFRGPMQKMLQRAIDAGLLHLKAEAERRANR
ncbi:Polyketide cyclase / dehydrase and lipid transport [uncultured archaeon]|nr:Polyketide cyclase / dehydrase and lipid transport [uncultured archaeon]